MFYFVKARLKKLLRSEGAYDHALQHTDKHSFFKEQKLCLFVWKQTENIQLQYGL